MTLSSLSNDQQLLSAALPPHDRRVEIQVEVKGHGSAGELRLASVPGAGTYAYVDVIYVAHSEHGGEIVYISVMISRWLAAYYLVDGARTR